MRYLAIVTLLVGCGGSDKDADADLAPDGGADPAGECQADLDCEDGKVCVDHACVIGGACGQSTLDLAPVPPNLLLVLDRSCSMKQVPSGSVKTKWALTVDAVNQLVGAYNADVRFGLTVFPDISGGNCTQETFAYPVADNNGPSISSLLTSSTQTADALYPDGPCVTNIDTALIQAAADPALTDQTRKSYLMLITDGAQSSCNAGGGDAGSEAAVKQLFDDRGIKTFVVGFGGAVDGAELDKLATLGGAALAATPKYYKAETATELDMAMQAIADQVASCDYTIDPAPPFLGKTYVWFEKTSKVPRDTSHVDGWDFDTTTNTLTFYGSYCSQLKTHAVDTVDVVYDCDGPLL
jgi:hypothetical protein